MRAEAFSFATLAALLCISNGALSASAAQAVDQPSVAAPSAVELGQVAKLTVPILMARELRDVQPPLSLLDLAPADDGVAGGKLAIADNNTTGRFLNQEFSLDIVENAKPEGLIADVIAKVEAGHRDEAEAPCDWPQTYGLCSIPVPTTSPRRTDT